MGGYGPVVPISDDEDEQQKYSPYPPVGPVLNDGYSDMPPVSASVSPVAPAAPAMPPVGSTGDLESKASKLSGYHPVEPERSPAEQQLESIASQPLAEPKEYHGFKKGLDILGRLYAPGLEQSIRYAPVIKQEQELKRAEGAVAAEQKPEEERAKTGELKSRGEWEQAHADAVRNPQETWKAVTGIAGPNGEPVELNERSGQYRYGNVTAKPLKNPTESAAADKQANEAIAAKAAAAGFPLNDPRKFQQNLDAAVKANAITKEDASKISGYETFNSTPATNLTVHVAGAQASDKIRDAHKFYQYTDENGDLQWASGDKVPANAEGVAPIKDIEGKLSSANNTNLVQKSFNSLANHDTKMFDDATVRAVLATALDEHQARSAGLLVAGTGGEISLPAGFGKIIDQMLQNKAVPKQYQREVKDFIADYYSMKDKLITLQMDIQNGKMGRAALPMIQAMYNQLPGLATADSVMAERQLGNLQQFIAAIKHDNFPEQYGRFSREPDFERKQEQTASANNTGAETVPPRPANVPGDYIFKANGPKGRGWYKP